MSHRQVFVSYAHKNRDAFDEVMAQLVPQAEAIGWSVWSDLLLPDELDPTDGVTARALIEPELDRSEAILVLLSEHMARSRFIREVEAIRISHMDVQLYTEIIILNLDGTALIEHPLSEHEIEIEHNYQALSSDARRSAVARIVDVLSQLRTIHEAGAA